jgi:hypothetical protein
MGSIFCASRKSTISLPVRTNVSGAGFEAGSLLFSVLEGEVSRGVLSLGRTGSAGVMVSGDRASGDTPLILLARAMWPSSVLVNFLGNMKERIMEERNPAPHEVMFPATALVASPVVLTLIAPERNCVTMNHAITPEEKPIQGERRTASVDIRVQRRMRPTGMEAPPTIMPRTVSSQVRFIEAALRMQQNLIDVQY